MEHTFGDKCVERCFDEMVWSRGRTLLDLLTDEARDELLRRCITRHKLSRKFAAESRKLHRERMALHDETVAKPDDGVQS
jgi:hypothetical protein